MSEEPNGEHGWLIEDWLPIGHRVMDTSTEGSFKTMTGCYLSVCVAAGERFLGKNVRQGPVLIVDEETPEPDLKNHLQRFAQGFGCASWKDLPITVKSMQRFKFDRKTELARLLKWVNDNKPVFIRIDSALACLPGGRQGMGENNAETGIAIRDDLNIILQEMPECSILLSAHSKKFAGELGLKQLKEYDMQSLVRGHGSIVGEACDTGLIIKKISEHPKPTRFVILTKARRRAVPMVAKDVYVELEEEDYGKGPARLKEIAPQVIPPSKPASDLYWIFDAEEPVTASTIVKKAAFYTKKENQMGVEELLERQVIVPAIGEPFSYKLNPRLRTQVDKDYLAALDKARKSES